MFSNKKADNKIISPKENEILLKEKELEEKINKEVIIHNMPVDFRSGKFEQVAPSAEIKTSNTISSQTTSLPPTKPNNISLSKVSDSPKKMGLIIIGGGVIVVGILIYIVVSVVIKPAAKQKVLVETPVENTEVVNEEELNTEEIVTPNVLETPNTNINLSSGLGALNSSESLVSSSVEEVNTNPDQVVSPLALKEAKDGDADGLDDEEEIIFGTNSTKTDTNNNGYEDRAEILNLYNPSGIGKLVDSNLVTKYTNSDFNYNVLYPKNWNARAMNNGSSVIFSAPDESFIQLVVQPNNEHKDIATWYQAQFPGKTDVTTPATVSNFTFLKTTDDLIVYITDKDQKNIYIFSYTPLSAPIYKTVFEMMIKSFLNGVN
ncbi:MAG: hypothetical protein MUF50_02265 [Planctomycetes bacterium]|jgi:hypothetical protein|nr:hypothetical protein [Planctomycetota bacterium]